ncbi:MAG TPA: VCBS repeat-containing protein [Kofleriaceae bacterium]|nr:VCBS repeat-containing protein [Kofleriaceae bacterium]
MLMRSFGLLAPLLVLSRPSRAVADTDFNGDGRADIAFHRPDGSSTTLGTLRSNGNGSWASIGSTVPSWANQTGAVALPGDYNGDGRSDIAFHRPGGGWSTVPVLMSNVNGTWTAYNTTAPGWANQPGATAVVGDYDGDGRSDIAFHRPGGGWGSAPMLRSNGNGTWTAYNTTAPDWANQPDVVAIGGDYNGDGRSDIAFHRPGGGWGSAPILMSNGNGTWTAYNMTAPSWANQAGAVAVGGDYNGDGRSDIAFHAPGSGGTSVSVLLSNGNGAWSAESTAAPDWANQAGAIAVGGDYNHDGRADLAFYRPDGVWNSVPVLLRTAAGGWTAHNFTAPSWANQPSVVGVAGDYNADGRSDIAFYRPDGTWGSAPMLLSNGNGSWTAHNFTAPIWVNQPGSVAVLDGQRRASLAHPSALADGGDPAYDQTPSEADDWRDLLVPWLNFLRLFVRVVQGYDEYVRQSGLMGAYDGTLRNGHSSAPAVLVLEHGEGEVHGKLYVLAASIRLDGGICSDVVFPVSVLPVHATSSDLYHASGTTTRDVSVLGVGAGTVDVDFDMSLETVTYTVLTGGMSIDVPWPCANQSLSFRFDRRPL